MKKLFVVICSLFILSGCATNNKNIDEIKDADFKSYDGTFTVVASNRWDEVFEKGTLNDSADMELIDDSNNKYLIALMESKEDITWNYNEYSEFILKQNEEIYQAKFEEVKKVSINDYDVNYVEFKAQHNSVNVYMRIYILETKNYYGQLIMWTKYSQKDEVSEEFDNIALSFKEIEK